MRANKSALSRDILDSSVVSVTSSQSVCIRGNEVADVTEQDHHVHVKPGGKPLIFRTYTNVQSTGKFRLYLSFVYISQKRCQDKERLAPEYLRLCLMAAH